MYEELRKAYDTTADRIWLANCGDLKGAEMQVSLFLDMAYDIDSLMRIMWLPIPPVGWQRCLGSSIIAYLKISLLRISIWPFPGNRNIWVGDIGIIIGRGRETYGYGVLFCQL